MALLRWYTQEVGDSLISALVVSREGLVVDILTRDKNKDDEKRFIGAFGSLVELVLRKLTLDFDLGTFGAGTFDTDKYRLIFCEAGVGHVLVTILDPLTMVDDVFPYTYMAAEKVARIIDGTLPVSPVMPKITRETEIEKIKRKMDFYKKKMSYSPDFVYKLSLIGDGGVGKTSIVQRYVNDIFSETYMATIGTFITKKEIQFEKLNARVRFMIWDIAGQEQFKRIWPDYLIDSNAGIIVFDITNRESFINIKNWYNTITRVALPNLILILAGNKVDLEADRVVSHEEGQSLANELGVSYIETSAKTNEKIEDVFEWVALQIINLKIVPDGIPMTGEVIKKDSAYLISEPQLVFLRQYFTKQLDYVVDKHESQKFLKYLDLLKSIEKKEVP